MRAVCRGPVSAGRQPLEPFNNLFRRVGNPCPQAVPAKASGSSGRVRLRGSQGSMSAAQHRYRWLNGMSDLPILLLPSVLYIPGCISKIQDNADQGANCAPPNALNAGNSVR
eukprot:1161442-Pelagomonas_calceolata.AAC.8